MKGPANFTITIAGHSRETRRSLRQAIRWVKRLARKAGQEAIVENLTNGNKLSISIAGLINLYRK